MRLTRALSLALLAAAAAPLAAQAPVAAPAPTAAAPTPTPEPSPAAPAAESLTLPLPAPIAPKPMKIKEAPVVPVAKLPSENPFGATPEAPAAIPAKLPFAEATIAAGLYVSVHVDAAGKVLAVRRERDPIPSLAADLLKSISRWTFSPGRRAGQTVTTWGAYRIDLAVEVRAPKVQQIAFTPVTPSSALPTPFEWPPDAEWVGGRHGSAPTDGSVPLDQVESAPFPQKTPWSADSFKGPFTVKYWVRVDKAGKITRAIPLDVSDPALLTYFRNAMNAWIIRPAQNAGAPVDSWNELTLGGTISYSDEIKQIIALKQAIGQ